MTCKKIKMSRGFEILVSENDFECVSRFKWWPLFSSGGNPAYARTDLRVNTPRGKKCVLLHRLLLNPSPYEQVDHINGNTLDNRRENLRLVTNSQNQRNRKKCVGTSGYKGVTRYRDGKRWTAYIYLPGKKRVHLGLFNSPEMAAIEYDEAAKEFFGEYCSTNFR